MDYALDIIKQLNALIDSIIQLSRALNISVTAEGVETEEQLQYLKNNKCNYIQGYLWGKPLNEQDAENVLMEEKNKDNMLIKQCTLP